jgi:integrase
LKQPVAMLDLSTPRKKRAPRRLLDDAQRAVIEERAREQRQWPLVHCLMTYGWRPSSASRMLVGDVNLSARTVLLRELKSGDALVHPLRGDTVELLRPLVQGRRSNEPLFTAPLGGAWRIDNGTRAHQMASWYRINISPDFPTDQRGIYDLKRYAITGLLKAAGGDPAAVAAITGHRSLSQVLVYARTNLDTARAVIDQL